MRKSGYPVVPISGILIVVFCISDNRSFQRELKGRKSCRSVDRRGREPVTLASHSHGHGGRAPGSEGKDWEPSEMAGDLAMTRFGRDRQKRSDWISAVDLAGCHAWPELEGADVIETTFLSLIGRHAAASSCRTSLTLNLARCCGFIQVRQPLSYKSAQP